MLTLRDHFAAASATKKYTAMDRPYLHSDFALDLLAKNQFIREDKIQEAVAKAEEHVKDPKTPLVYCIKYYLMLTSAMPTWNDGDWYLSSAEHAFKELLIIASGTHDDFMTDVIMPGLQFDLDEMNEQRRQDFHTYCGIALEDNFRERMRDYTAFGFDTRDPIEITEDLWAAVGGLECHMQKGDAASKANAEKTLDDVSVKPEEATVEKTEKTLDDVFTELLVRSEKAKTKETLEDVFAEFEMERARHEKPTSEKPIDDVSKQLEENCLRDEKVEAKKPIKHLLKDFSGVHVRDEKIKDEMAIKRLLQDFNSEEVRDEMAEDKEKKIKHLPSDFAEEVRRPFDG